ncbi:MAG: phosphatidylserine decarboxylase [Candidatus Marinimicrobia bacterium]|jgi:phosphatidylserine decarboxylase|nr:phosphatidylserine decarboxylase [Candidatus Neomarinimicrobiota bacterium]
MAAKSTTLSFLFITIFSELLYLIFRNVIYVNSFLLIVVYISLLLFLFSLYFFRDPQRETPEGKNILISPADGKIISIKDNILHPVSKEPSQMVSIFLSLLDVHINRIPIGGKISLIEYHKGKFLAAFNPKASELNEKYIFDINSKYGSIRVQQIAGIIARRLVCNLQLNDMAKAGKKFGLMKFSSRIDLIIPKKHFKLNTKIGEKVRGGETIIGEFINNDEIK